jgi:hypothetical protein
MLSEASKVEKANYHMFHSFVESRPKKMMMGMIIIILGHECKSGNLLGRNY